MKIHRIIQTVGKHVIAQDALAGACIGVGIDESAQFGIIITGLEVVERGLGIVIISTIAEGMRTPRLFLNSPSILKRLPQVP